MDLTAIEAVVGELREKLCGAAVGKVHQPGAADLVLRLWNGRENLRLLLSAAPGSSRLHLTTAPFPNPASPPRFCQLLRARLSRLLEIERVPGERIVRFLFAGPQGERWTLVAEFTGTHPNLVLLDAAGAIVDVLFRDERRRRPLLPGHPYILPESRTSFSLEDGVPDLPAGDSLCSWLLDNVTPMTPLLAADVAAAADPRQALERYRSRWTDRDFRPCTALWQGRPVLTVLLPECLELDQVRSFASPSTAADAFYADRAEEELFGGGRRELAKVARKGLTRLARRLEHIEAERGKALDAERQGQLGDLLLGNLHRLRRGMDKVVLDDWYADPPAPVTVPLDPALSPQQNAERFFRRQRKGRRALEHTARRTAETRDEMVWLEGVLLALEEAEGAGEVRAVRTEMEAAGLLRPQGTPPGRKQSVSEEPAVGRARTPSGYLLVWGRNNRSNDHVSRQLTAPDDLWFHAHNLPGCHLVLKRDASRGEIPEVDILYAAALAAGHSRGKDAGKVEVMVAEGRAVRKPKGARPGLVTVERYRTVVVRPCREG